MPVIPILWTETAGQIDYDQLLAQAKEVRPRLIIAGASAYPRIIDFKRFREIADEVGAFLLGDMAHIAGLVAAELHPSPVPHAHFVTTSTQKTLRGPRGGMILLGEETAGEFAQRVDRALFPGTQGAAHMHIIAAKAVALGEALQPNFVAYQRNVLNNAKALAEEPDAMRLSSRHRGNGQSSDGSGFASAKHHRG